MFTTRKNMRNIILSIIILFACVTLAYGQAQSPQELADSYKEFHDKKDIDQVVALFYSKYAASSYVSTINHVLKSEFEEGDKIEQIIINEIDQGELEKMTNGIPYGDKLLAVPTINKLTHTMKVMLVRDGPYSLETTQEFHMGKTELDYLLTMSKLIEP